MRSLSVGRSRRADGGEEVKEYAMFGDIGKIMKMASELKRKMPEMQEKLAASEYSASVGGGMVTATVNGKLAMVDLKIDSRVFSEAASDVAMLEDLVKAAVSAAQAKATEAAAAAMKELTGGMDLPPGLF